MGGIKLKLDLAIGESSALDAADKGKINDIVQKVKDLNGRLQDIRREQVFQRVCFDMIFYLFIFHSFLRGRRGVSIAPLPRGHLYLRTFILTISSFNPQEREAEFRDQSESTNARVVRWTLVQLVVLGITCAWQLSHLRSFFIKQKLT
jgi:hypothetical protein